MIRHCAYESAAGKTAGRRSCAQSQRARRLQLAHPIMSLHLHIDRGDQPITMHFVSFPVRIGRGTDAECRLEFPHVSRVHARIDLVDGQLLLQDEGSTTGTWVHDHSRRLQKGATVALATVGNEFHIGPDLRLRVELEADEPTIQRVEGGMIATKCYEQHNVDPQALDADAVERALLEAVADARRASEQLATVLVQATACSPDHVKRFAKMVVDADPEWDGRAPIRHFVTLSGIRPAPSRVDTTALLVLQELASSYVPYAPALSSVESVTEFATRLDTVLSLLIEGVASMRYAIEREAGGGAAAGPARRDLGACLLDWTNDGAHVDRLRDELRFMIGHHRRLVDEVTSRVAGIVAYLSPDAIERDPASKAKGWGNRHKALWKELRRRHTEVVRLRERALGPIFGRVVRALRGDEGKPSSARIGSFVEDVVRQ